MPGLRNAKATPGTSLNQLPGYSDGKRELGFTVSTKDPKNAEIAEGIREPVLRSGFKPGEGR